LEDWGKDVKLMCDNARFYNEPDSVVYRNAEEIEVCPSKLRLSYLGSWNVVLRPGIENR
jgi:hypothetical protein